MIPEDEQAFLKVQTIPEALNLHEENSRTAIVCGSESVTYREWIGRVRALARSIRASGTEKGDRILLNLDRGVPFLTALFGILYAGAAYIVADRSWPEKRLGHIRRDSGAAFVLDESKFFELQDTKLQDTTCGGSLPTLRGEDEFAVYYTSGSTGEPKGCVSHHQVHYSSAVPVPENVHACETMKRCEVVLSSGNLAFSGVLQDVFTTLLCGKTLVLASEEERMDPCLLGERMLSCGVDAVTMTPSQLVSFLSDESFREACGRVRRFSVLGESLTTSMEERIREASDGCIVLNYGSSETSKISACLIEPGEDIRIGKAVWGANVFCIDSAGHKAGPETEGEICVGGIPARLGYYVGAPALTDRKYSCMEGIGRIYHTGDVGLVHADGSISILGRIDNMKKLHGQRIEIQEIERCMEECPGVDRAAADVRGEGQEAALFAWYTTSEAVEEAKIRAHLMNKLPPYMVPQRMRRMKELPLNQNGKLDRRSLPEIEARQETCKPPANAREKLICSAFSEILKTEEVGRDSHFFLLGGSSLSAMHLISRLRERLGVSYSLDDIFQNPTPRTLASLHTESLEEGTAGSGPCEQQPHGKQPCEQQPYGTQPYGGQPHEQGLYSRELQLPPELEGLAAAENTEAVLPVDRFSSHFVFARQLSTEHRVGEIRRRVTLRGTWTWEEFLDRARVLTANHPVLRSEYVPASDGRFYQIVSREKEPVVFCKDLRMLDDEARERYLSGFWQVLSGEKDLFAMALFAVSDERSVLLIRTDHTITDGVSMTVIQNELCADDYRALPCDSFLAFRKKSLAEDAGVCEEAKRYYAALQGYELPAARKDAKAHRYAADTLCFFGEEHKRLLEQCADAHCSVFTWFFLCHARALMAMREKEQIWLRHLDNGRDAFNPGEMRIVGNLAQIKPVLVQRDMTATRLQEVFLRLRRFNRIAESELFSRIDLRRMEQGLISEDLGALSSHIEDSERVFAQDQISGPVMRLDKDGLLLRVPYDASEKKTHDRFLDRLREELRRPVE